MFCGIVDHIGIIEKIEQRSKGILLRIRSKFNDFMPGESIAIDGVCLTVSAFDGQIFDCELSPETLDVTAASYYQKGQLVNLERAMRMGDRIGGHFVTGHVDQTILVTAQQSLDAFVELCFYDLSQENLAYLVPKGSVTINGVSLTVNRVDETGFSVSLIPHTLERTNLSNLNPRDRVNVEWDYMAKLVRKQILGSHLV